MREPTEVPVNARRDVTPLVVHIVHRFDYGGLENGLVNVINTMDADAYRHAVIALTEATGFAQRIRRKDTAVYSLGKQPGKDLHAYLRLWSLLRRLRPSILHTRNMGTLDCVLVGRLAGIQVCVHGEHGWDTHDPDGTVRKYRILRRLIGRFVARFITVSEHLASWLINTVGIPAGKVTAICNGVDTAKFRPLPTSVPSPLPTGIKDAGAVVIGTVSRFEAIKDPLNLVRAFISAHAACAKSGVKLRLVMIGDGALKAAADEAIRDAGLEHCCWLPGMRDDIAELMRQFDVFVLASKREGISNTVLEALASGLPVIATRTGGNPQLIEDNAVGRLVDPEDSAMLATAIEAYAVDAELRRTHGQAARQRAEQRYSLAAMARNYQNVYAAVLN